MKQHEVIWLAGLLEGEGCFNVRKDKNMQPRVSIEMTDKDIIERAAKLFGSNISTRAPRVLGTCSTCAGDSRTCSIGIAFKDGDGDDQVARHYGFSRTKEAYQTAIYGDRARNLMRLVYPFMGQRRGAKIAEILGSLV